MFIFLVMQMNGSVIQTNIVLILASPSELVLNSSVSSEEAATDFLKLHCKNETLVSSEVACAIIGLITKRIHMLLNVFNIVKII